MNTRIRLVGVSMALTVSAVAAAALAAPTTVAVDQPDGSIAAVAVEHCGNVGPAGPSSEDVSDVLTHVARNVFAPITPIFRFP